MESKPKKISNFLRNLAWFSDYYLFKLKKIFSKEKPLPEIKNILIIELTEIGDIIVTTPTIRALKEKFPKANIDILVKPSMRNVITNNPNIHDVLVYKKKEVKQNFNIIVNDLKKYDLAVILHARSIGNYLICKILKKAKIPYRIGCTRVGFLESKGFFLHKKTKPTFKIKHKIEDNLDVVRTINADTYDKHLEIYTSKKSEQSINNLLKKNNISKKDFLVVIHPIPKVKTHEWIDSRFALLADTLINKYKLKILFTGSKKDKTSIDNIIKLINNKAINTSGTNIKEFFSLIKKSNLVISVDTAAMHVAAAFNKPIIALFGAGNPKIWKPYCDNSIVIFKNNVCTSCMKHRCYKTKNKMQCMLAIEINDVLKAFETLKNECNFNFN